MSAASTSLARRAASIPLRCFFPLAALVILLGTAVWGGWISLVLAIGLWRAIGRWA